MKNCCNHKKTSKKCIRKDKKTFSLHRKFSKKRCMKGVKGYTMRSSCAPYKFCKAKTRHTGGGTRKKQNKKKRTSKMQFLYLDPHYPELLHYKNIL